MHLRDQGLLLLRQTKRKALTRLGRPQGAGRFLKVFPDDVFIVSYPRSGNTWIRFLIGSIVYKQDINFDNMEQYVPDIYRGTNQFLESLQHPRILKSHEPYDERYPKVIYLIRDPRDVAISYFRWLQKFRGYKSSLDDFLVAFTANQTKYGGWGGNVQSWADNRDNIKNGMLVIRYEDLLTQTIPVLQQITVFLGQDISAQQLETIVDENSFTRMRKKEVEAEDSNFIKGQREDIKFIRRGTAGQWKDLYSEAQLNLFAQSFQDIAGVWGYDLGVFG